MVTSGSTHKIVIYIPTHAVIADRMPINSMCSFIYLAPAFWGSSFGIMVDKAHSVKYKNCSTPRICLPEHILLA